VNEQNLRQVINVARAAARHAAVRYQHMDGDTAAQLLALLTGIALA
jgi:hypothetical protein